MSKESIKWHPAFVAAIQLDFKEYSEHLDYLIEHNLTDEPLKIDTVVIKKLDDIVITRDIGRIFKKYNILEYKSPTDYIAIDDYYKVKAYAYLYKALSKQTNGIAVEEMTLTFVSCRKPKKLIKYLMKDLKVEVKESYKGIYYVDGTDIDTQIVVTKNLSDEGLEYLKLLQFEHKDGSMLDKWLGEYIDNSKNSLYSIIMNVLEESNPEEILEVYSKMGVAKISEAHREFLLEAMKKLEIDKKIKEEEGEIKRIDTINSLIKLLGKRFNEIPESYLVRIRNLTYENAKQAIEDIFDMKSVEDIQNYY